MKYLNITRHPIKTLLTVGMGFVTVGLLLFVLFIAANPIQQSQDDRSNASVGNGSVSITSDQSPQPFTTAGENTITLKANTSGKAVDGVQLSFDIIGTFNQPPEISLSTSRLRILSQEVSNMGHGYNINVILATLDPSQSYATTSPEAILAIKFNAPYAGNVKLNFDKENSISTEHASNPPKDTLTHIPEMSFTITGTTAPTPTKDDFYLTTDDISSRYKMFETTGSRNEVDKSKLVAGRSYTVKHTAKVQNVLDNAAVGGDPTISVKLQVNDDETDTRTFKRSSLTTSNNPLDVELQTDFVAKSDNTFKVTVDSAKAFVEDNEGNNTVSNTYSFSNSAKSCNEVCSSNSECPTNYRCATVGSEKRCRLNSNVDSSSCQDANGIGNRSCNQTCADTSECASGYTCWYNTCRNPENVESTSCAALSTQTQTAIANSCNQSCTANRDCAINMRCFNGSCRLAANPSSTSCSAVIVSSSTSGSGTATKGGVSRGTTATPVPTATPRVTPSPTATASALPTATPYPSYSPEPSPMPTAEPESSALQSLWNRFTSSLNFSNILSGGMIPVAVIGAGILLLVIALIIVLRPKSKTIYTTGPSTQTTKPVTPTSTLDMKSKPNPAPPSIPGHGVIPAQKSEFAPKNTIAGISNPGEIEMPKDEKSSDSKGSNSTPPESTLKTQTAPGGSMMQRLKDKGVEAPNQGSSQPQTQGSAPSTNANKYQWPDEEVK